MKLYILITILVCLCKVTLPFSCIPQAKKLNHDALFSVSSSGESVDLDAIKTRILGELREVTECATIATKSLWYSESSVTPEEIVKVCDELDDIVINEKLLSSSQLQLRRRALEFQRYELLCKLMRKDYQAYVAIASFLSPSRIPRKQLPNLQDIPVDPSFMSLLPSVESGLVPDCSLESVPYDESILDQVLLQIFRSLVTKNTGGLTSNKPGIDGLLEQGRTFMLLPNQTDDAQHRMVRDTLRGLMTPVLPPFYRVFMAGIVPSIFGTEWDGKQLGPWFYAPFLTSFVTPTFFGFLVGPSYPNRRKDGQLGGLVVEKCKFLQESGCKGLCLHQCKLPAQQFFKEELGLPLTVSPNFVTQECQWSFGEEPLPPSEDPSFPKGCLVGCESRKALVGRMVDLCN